MSLVLSLQLARNGPYVLGDTVEGSVLVVEGGRSRSLEVCLRYHEETRDYSSVSENISSGPLHDGDLETSASFPFKIAIPEDALPGYRAMHGELYWDVDVMSDELGPDTHVSRRIDVQPRPRTTQG